MAEVDSIAQFTQADAAHSPDTFVDFACDFLWRAAALRGQFGGGSGEQPTSARVE